MSISDAWRDVLAETVLPERELLREPDRLQSYTDAFLRGDIDVNRYTTLTLAEIERRTSLPVDLPTRRPASPRLAQPVIEAGSSAYSNPRREWGDRIGAAPRAPRIAQDSRSLAEAYVRGEIGGDEYLRRVRDV